MRVLVWGVGLVAVASVACSFDSTGGNGDDSSSGSDSADTETTSSTGSTAATRTTQGPGTATTNSATATATTRGPTAGTTTMPATETSDDTTGDPIRGCPDDPALVACYTFEDRGASGEELIDGSSHGNDGTAEGVNYSAGPFEDALEHGEQGEVRIPESATLDISDQLTIEVWVNPSILGGANNLVENDSQYRLFLSENGVTCRKPGEEVVFNTAVATGEWVHIACRYDDGDVDLFVGGELVASAVWSPIGIGGTFGTALGNALPNLNAPYFGLLDNVRIWNRPLTDNEIGEAAEALE